MHDTIIHVFKKWTQCGVLTDCFYSMASIVLVVIQQKSADSFDNMT